MNIGQNIVVFTLFFFRHEIEVHDLRVNTDDGDRDPQGCSSAGCGLVFSTKTTRKR